MLSAYITSQEVSGKNYYVSVCNVSAGTYGTSTIFPQITVNEAGIITEIVRVTAPAGAGGVCALNDLSDASTDAAVSGDCLKYISGEWIPRAPELVYSYMISVTAERTNAVETTVPGWSMTLTSSAIYNIEWRAWMYAASVPDVKFNLGKSDTGTIGRYNNQNTALAVNTQTSVNTALAVVVPGSTYYQADFVGHLITGTSTTNMWVTFAQNVSTGATPCKLLPGSWLKVYKN
jgi:hypothetical protein